MDKYFVVTRVGTQVYVYNDKRLIPVEPKAEVILATAEGFDSEKAAVQVVLAYRRRMPFVASWSRATVYSTAEVTLHFG